jgi:hypothetical protein
MLRGVRVGSMDTRILSESVCDNCKFIHFSDEQCPAKLRDLDVKNDMVTCSKFEDNKTCPNCKVSHNGMFEDCYQCFDCIGEDEYDIRREEAESIMARYIISSEDFNKSMFHFQKDKKYLIVNEQPDAYVFELEDGSIDQISKGYLKDQSALRIIHG